MTENTSRIRVGIVLLDGSQVLVVQMHRDKGDIFVLPGGGLELNEGIFECAKREAKEELNVDVEIERVLYLKDLCTEKDHALEIIVLGKIAKGTATKGYDPENKGKNILKDIKYIDVADLSKLNFHPKQLREILPVDVKNKFKKDVQYLGKHNYPEK